MKRLLKGLAALIAAIFIGALGSGAWEHILSPAIFNASAWVFQLINEVQTSFIDDIYIFSSHPISYLHHRQLVLFAPFTLINIFFIYRFSRPSIFKEYAKKNAGIKIVYGYILFVACLNFVQIMKVSFATNINIYVSKSSEILRPNMGEKAYIQLRSDLLQIETKEQLTSLINQAKESYGQGLSLPEEPDI